MSLFELKINFESDWYTHLLTNNNKFLELGIIDKNYGLVPKSYSDKPMGIYITFPDGKLVDISSLDDA